jgi:hypothetical protein
MKQIHWKGVILSDEKNNKTRKKAAQSSSVAVIALRGRRRHVDHRLRGRALRDNA